MLVKIKKYSIIQRNNIYKKALITLLDPKPRENWGLDCICHSLIHTIDPESDVYVENDLLEAFPEFALFEQMSSYWFNSKEERIHCLAFCIAMTEK